MNRFRTLLPLSILLSSIPAQSQDMCIQNGSSMTKEKLEISEELHRLEKFKDERENNYREYFDELTAKSLFKDGKIVSRKKNVRNEVKSGDFLEPTNELILGPKPSEPFPSNSVKIRPLDEDGKKRAFYILQRLNCFYEENKDDLDFLLADNINTYSTVKQAPLLTALIKSNETNKRTEAQLATYQTAQRQYDAEKMRVEQRRTELNLRKAKLEEQVEEKKKERRLNLDRMISEGCEPDPFLADPRSRKRLSLYLPEEFEEVLLKKAITPEGLLAKEGDAYSFVANLICNQNIGVIRVLYDNYMLPKNMIIQALSEKGLFFTELTWKFLKYLYYFQDKSANGDRIAFFFDNWHLGHYKEADSTIPLIEFETNVNLRKDLSTAPVSFLSILIDKKILNNDSIMIKDIQGHNFLMLLIDKGNESAIQALQKFGFLPKQTLIDVLSERGLSFTYDTKRFLQELYHMEDSEFSAYARCCINPKKPWKGYFYITPSRPAIRLF